MTLYDLRRDLEEAKQQVSDRRSELVDGLRDLDDQKKELFDTYNEEIRDLQETITSLEKRIEEWPNERSPVSAEGREDGQETGETVARERDSSRRDADDGS